MSRTTFEIEASVLRELERLQEREGKPLGQLISELVAAALPAEAEAPEPRPPFQWISRPMRARIGLEGKEPVRTVLDAS